MHEHSNIKDRVDGNFHQVRGQIKKVIGKMFYNQEMEAEGRKENAFGKVRNKLGQVEKVLGM